METLTITTSWDDGHVLDLRVAELLDRYDMVDRTAYAKNLSAIVAAAKSHSIPVLDYDNTLPYEYFSDMVHPLPEGNKLLAKKLVRDLIDKGYLANTL